MPTPLKARENAGLLGVGEHIALVLIVTLLLWATGAPLYVDHAHASNLANVSDTLTNSAPGLFSGHTIVYTNATSTAAGPLAMHLRKLETPPRRAISRSNITTAQRQPSRSSAPADRE
jgi:hypothetical protein